MYEIPGVILGKGITALGSVRTLGRAGITVYCLGEKKSEAIYSKYCKKYFIFHNIRKTKEELKNVLIKLKSHIRETTVIFPTADIYLLLIPDLINDLNGYHIPIPKRKTFEILINKRKFYQSLIQKKIHHPITYFPESLKDVKKLSKDLSYPIFLKPYHSFIFREHFRKKGIVANSQRELLSYWLMTKNLGVDMMMQEIIFSPQSNHIFLDGFIDRDLKPKALFARQRVRSYPTDFGNSSITKSVPISDYISLKDTILKYLQSITYHGLFNAEFVMDSRDGLFKLIEINARASAWFNTLSAKCGINLMLIAYQDAIGENTEYREDYEPGVKWLCGRDDLNSSIRLLLNGELGIREWIHSLSGKKDYAWFAKDDFKPFAMNIIFSLSKIFE